MLSRILSGQQDQKSVIFFAQRYQSQPITRKITKTLLIFSKPSETMSNISPSEYDA